MERHTATGYWAMRLRVEGPCGTSAGRDDLRVWAVKTYMASAPAEVHGGAAVFKPITFDDAEVRAMCSAHEAACLRLGISVSDARIGAA